MFVFIQHHVEQAFKGEPGIYLIYVVGLPIFTTFLLPQILVTRLDYVASHVRVQVMNMVILNPICEGTEPKRNL